MECLCESGLSLILEKTQRVKKTEICLSSNQSIWNNSITSRQHPNIDSEVTKCVEL